MRYAIFGIVLPFIAATLVGVVVPVALSYVIFCTISGTWHTLNVTQWSPLVHALISVWSAYIMLNCATELRELYLKRKTMGML